MPCLPHDVVRAAVSGRGTGAAPGVWSIRLTMPIRSSGPNLSSSSTSVSEQTSARRCRKWLIRSAPCRPQAKDFIGQRPGIFAIVGLGVRHDRAHPQRIENRGDPDAGQFGVMGDDGGGMGPVDLGARLDVAFEVVGVQLDQAGHHQIAAAIDGARRARLRLRRCRRSGRRAGGSARAGLRVGRTRVALARMVSVIVSLSCLALSGGRAATDRGPSHPCDKARDRPPAWTR